MNDLVRSVRSNPPIARRLTLSVVLLVVSLVVGVMERRQLAPLQLRRAQLEASAARMREFRSAFVPISAAESASWRRAADTVDIAVAHGTRLTLAQTLAASAEGAGLRGVRVLFEKPDSAYVPPRSRGVSTTDVTTADYTIAIDGIGAFAQVLSFVNVLPPSVSITRVVGAREKTGTHYRITIAVYETSRDGQTD